MSLPLPWVDKIFEKLVLTYGQPFLARWRDLDLNAVKFDWSRELGGFENNPKAIAYALQNTDPEKPPTVGMFRAIALRAPGADSPRLPEPAANPERVAAELAKLLPLRQSTSAAPEVDHRAWAKKIMARCEWGQKIKPYTLRCACEVLRLEVPKQASKSAANPTPTDHHEARYA